MIKLKAIVPTALNSAIPALLLFLLTILSCGQQAPPPFECNDNKGCVTIAPGDPVKIGVLQAISGEVAPLGTEQIRGLNLALHTDKWKGKILGHPLKLQIEDTGCTSEGGANAALKILADPQSVAIFGTTCSGAASTSARAMSEAGLTMISGNNSAPFLTSIGGKPAPNWNPGYFRTANNEETAGKAAAAYAFKKLGIRKVATLNDGDIYTRGLTDGFTQAFEALGGKTVLDTSVNKGDKIMRPVLISIVNSGAELLFFPLFQPEGNLILKQAREIPDYKDIVLMSDGALILDSFIQDVMDKGKGMYFVGPDSPETPATRDLSLKYREQFNTKPDNNYYLTAFDAAMLLFKAIEETAVAEPDGTLHIGRDALRKTMYATREFAGVTGTLSCDEFGDCSRPAFKILRLDNPGAGIKGLQDNIIFQYNEEQ